MSRNNLQLALKVPTDSPTVTRISLFGEPDKYQRWESIALLVYPSQSPRNLVLKIIRGIMKLVTSHIKFLVYRTIKEITCWIKDKAVCQKDFSKETTL